jgi:hypothetical protein
MWDSLKKMIVAKLFKNFPAFFLELHDWLLCLQDPATGSFLKPVEDITHFHILVLQGPF